jgi:hypothetical protein
MIFLTGIFLVDAQGINPQILASFWYTRLPQEVPQVLSDL